MNCAICLAFIRQKNHCPGCREEDENKAKSCLSCIIINCEIIKHNSSKFCYECEKYPCKRLKQLDKRYRTRYAMSMLENLKYIKTSGLPAFVEKENERWRCRKCGGLICVTGVTAWPAGRNRGRRSNPQEIRLNYHL
jgi:hypothetical protein